MILEKQVFKAIYTITKPVVENNKIEQKNREVRIVEYPNNFTSNEGIIETTNILKHEFNSGFSKHFVFNGIRIEYRSLKLPVPLEAEVSLNFPYFKMHFSLEGNYSYKATNSKSLDLSLSKGQHQIFYFPEVREGIMSYTSKNITNKTLEITLSLDFIYRAFRNNWEVLGILGKAIKKETPFVFGKKGEIISSEIYLVIQQIKNCIVKKEFRKAYLETKVIELLLLQMNDLEKVKNIPLNIPEVKYFSEIKAAKIFIEKNIENNLTIPLIAKNVGLNINYLKSGFKALYNETIFQYLTSLRMQHANDLIKHTDYPISEIANKVGYKHPQHFTKTFKKHFIKTPSELRKKNS